MNATPNAEHDETLFPLPERLEDCIPFADEIANLIRAALLEVGVGVTEDNRHNGESGVTARAQRLAFEAYGIGYRLVPLDEYRSAITNHWPNRQRGASYGICWKRSWQLDAIS